MANRNTLKIGMTVYYKTRNDRAGRGVIEAIDGQNATLSYEIKTRFQTQSRRVIRPIADLFMSAAECERHILKTCGNMGNPTQKVANQFYRINAREHA